MEQIFLQVLGLDVYSWLVIILIIIVIGLVVVVMWLASAYTDAKSRLHVVTADSILAYQRIKEAMDYIRLDLQNFAIISNKGNDATAKSIEHRLDRIDNALDAIRRDLFKP
jgi:uncharacterized membrane protein YdfJ with MMPL/SSD domain